MRIWLPFFMWLFWLCALLCFAEVHFSFLGHEQASWQLHQLCPWCFDNAVFVQLAMVLVQIGAWPEVTGDQSLGTRPVVKISSSRAWPCHLLTGSWTLSGTRAVSLLSPQSASVTFSFVIRSSFKLAADRALYSPFQTAVLSSGLL